MTIRPFRTADFDVVVNFLKINGVEPPSEISDLGGICLIAEKGGMLQGVIYALIGQSTKAYIDFYAALTPQTAWTLLQHMETVLRLHGIKRYDFYVEKFNAKFSEMALNYGCQKLRDLDFFRRGL